MWSDVHRGNLHCSAEVLHNGLCMEEECLFSTDLSTTQSQYTQRCELWIKSQVNKAELSHRQPAAPFKRINVRPVPPFMVLRLHSI